jgi:AraC family transcriptional regulator, regulatory protein of adaptative response / methylated-DNA-[protein]-cysteine methyltransferase
MMNDTETTPFSTKASRWQAVVGRDPRADGVFLYAVTTTGVYCRPTCSSRRPQPQNVRFFDHSDAAESAGFRPCKRCQPRLEHPESSRVAGIARACQLIAEADEPPSLAELARAAGFSPVHFHRLFKLVTGVTPKEYVVQKRLEKVQNRLQYSATVTEAVFEAGYGSGSRFYENVDATLGMKPTVYREGGKGKEIRFALAPCYLGWVLVAATAAGICAIDLGGSPEELVAQLRARFPNAQLSDQDPEFAAWVDQVLSLLEVPECGLALPLDVQGTAFQRRVWQALQQIPAGSTRTYTEVAEEIGRPTAVRAVAQACAANKIAVAIPCHRVVRSDGSLSGYRWGVERKRRLLEREGVVNG